MAAASKKMILLGLGLCFLLLFSSLMIIFTDARTIHYGPIAMNNNTTCTSKTDPHGCLPSPTNKYDRDCNEITRCRHG